MPNLADISRGTQVLLVAAVLLFIDTFLAWQSVDIGVGEFEVSVSRNAWHGFWGVLLGLLTIALIAWVVLRLLKIVPPSVKLPAEAPLTALLAVLVLAFAVIKNLVDDYSAWASYVGMVLAALVVYGAWLRLQEQGISVDRMMTRSTEPPAAAPPPASIDES
jgi:hypothetical protein